MEQGKVTLPVVHLSEIEIRWLEPVLEIDGRKTPQERRLQVKINNGREGHWQDIPVVQEIVKP